MKSPLNAADSDATSALQKHARLGTHKHMDLGWCESIFACANQTSPGAENKCRSMGVTMLRSTSPTLSSETLPPQGHRERETDWEECLRTKEVSSIMASLSQQGAQQRGFVGMCMCVCVTVCVCVEAGQISRASQDILPASYPFNIQTRLFATDL
ncbi:hypothetical protein QQF64_019308 [Cirrhinus molitorella]|uniref:Uncharacterized protein n=1 Tax=Cirrhinus molitorella TaxID=172907 RepID=A0ABR3LF36_9TELE